MSNIVQDSQVDQWMRMCAVELLSNVVKIEGKGSDDYSAGRLIFKFSDRVSNEQSYIDAVKRYNEKKAQVDFYNLIKIIRVCKR